VVFREPKKGDAPQYLKLINDAIAERDSGLLMDRPAKLRDEERWVSARIEGVRRRRLVMLAAEVDGTIMGNCDVSREGWKRAHRATLGIVIAKQLRGKGVGEALMSKTIELAEKRLKGIEFIDLAVFDYNKRAMGLYTKLGFKEVGRIPRGMKEGSRYFDEILMTRPAKRKKR